MLSILRCLGLRSLGTLSIAVDYDVKDYNSTRNVNATPYELSCGRWPSDVRRQNCCTRASANDRCAAF